MGSLRIGFDLDGVLADFNPRYIRLLNDLAGTNAPLDHTPQQWNYEADLGFDKDTVKQAWQRIGEDPGFWASLPPTKFCEATIDRLQDLRADGNHIFFLTSRPGEYAHDATKRWLAYQGFINPKVTIANSAADKAKFAKEIGLQFFIDDKPENAEAVGAVVFYCYLLDAPYNRQWDNDKELILRVDHPVYALDHFIGGMTRNGE